MKGTASNGGYGRTAGLQEPSVRKEEGTFESALREQGINEALIAKELKEQLEAIQRRWNSKKKEYELFADNDARLGAVREVIKIFGGYPSEHNAGPLVIWLGALGRLNEEKYRRLQEDSVDSVRPEVAPVVPAKPAAAPEKVTCASTLRQMGVDEASIANKLKQLLEATQPRWNPKKKEYDLVADNDARLAAIREVVKIVSGYPSHEDEGGERKVIVMPGDPPEKEQRANGATAKPWPHRT